MKKTTVVPTFVLVLLAAAAYLRFGALPDPLPPDSESARIFEAGRHSVASVELTLVDSTRRTAAYGDFPGADARTLETTVWYPEGLPDDPEAGTSGAATRPLPLLVYSHGFTSSRTGAAYLVRHLASRGYIVAAADHPLTHSDAPDGPRIQDVANQPGDVRFLVDRFLEWHREPGHRLEGLVDEDRIGVVGLSLGGLAATLTAFHPRLGDPRIDAAASIAGPTFMLGSRFFEHRDVPFLMVGGDADAIVDFDTNARPVPQKVDGALLVRLAAGSHTGFADPARYMRFLDNPDGVGCAAVTANLDEEERWWEELGSPEEGILTGRAVPQVCDDDPLPEAMNPVQQQRLTTLAVSAFLESRFAEDPDDRVRSRRYLTEVLPREIPEVTVTGAGDGGACQRGAGCSFRRSERSIRERTRRVRTQVPDPHSGEGTKR